jgi:hypothetical protein
MRRLFRFIAFLWEHRADLSVMLSRSFWLSVIAVFTGTASAIVAAVRGVPVYLWIPLALVTMIFIELVILLALGTRVIIAQIKGSPLVILYDIINPNHRFYSIETHTDSATGKQGTHWEYRALIKNTAFETIKNVKVIVECIGPMPTRPEQSVFTIDRKPLRDLAPQEEALAVIRVWFNPIRVAGVALGEDIYGSIKMIAYGDNVQPRTKIFHFDAEKIPAVYEFTKNEISTREAPRRRCRRCPGCCSGTGTRRRRAACTWR